MAAINPLRLISSAPRSHLFTSTRSSTAFLTHRTLHTTQPLRQSSESKSPFSPFSGPSPPRLPKEEQELFEELQRQSTGAFSTPRSPPQINQSPDSSAAELAEASSTIEGRTDKLAGTDQANSQFKEDYQKVIEARGKGEELHPNVRRGAMPEFDGETNPKTGEVGGPKNEPLRWGAAGEWTYNGRTTDF